MTRKYDWVKKIGITLCIVIFLLRLFDVAPWQAHFDGLFYACILLLAVWFEYLKNKILHKKQKGTWLTKKYDFLFVLLLTGMVLLRLLNTFFLQSNYILIIQIALVPIALWSLYQRSQVQKKTKINP